MQRFCALAMALMLFVISSSGVLAFAQETSEEAPVAMDECRDAPVEPEQVASAAVAEPIHAPEESATESVSEQTPDQSTDEIEAKFTPEITLIPEETITPEASLAPEATPATAQTPAPTTGGEDAELAPEVSSAPSASAAPDAQITLAPECTPEPLPTTTLEAVLDATVAPDPSAEAPQGLEMLQKIKKSGYNRLDASRLPIPSNGMPIPQIYQGDYWQPVCISDGEYKSVASSGCGATAASMLIAYIAENYDQTPYTLFYWAAYQGYYTGSGLSIETVRLMLSHYGVSCRMESVSADAIVNALKENRAIIMLMEPGAFTQSGHYIVLRGLDENGMVLVNDPSSSARSAGAYAPQLIAREAKGGVMLVANAAKKRSAVTTKPKPENSVQAVPTLSDVQNRVAEATPAAQLPQPTVKAAYTAQVCVSCVNLRTQIGVDGEIAAQLEQGERVEVVEERTSASGNLWCKVLYQGQELYMRADMLEKIG